MWLRLVIVSNDRQTIIIIIDQRNQTVRQMKPR